MVRRRGAARQEVVAGLDVDKAVAIAGGPEMFCAMNTFIAPAYRLYCKGVRSTETFSDVRHEAKVTPVKRLGTAAACMRTPSIGASNKRTRPRMAHAHAAAQDGGGEFLFCDEYNNHMTDGTIKRDVRKTKFCAQVRCRARSLTRTQAQTRAHMPQA